MANVEANQKQIAILGFFGLSEKYLGRNTFFAQFLRKTRRTFYALFRRKYVRESIANVRKGECHRCGACCKLLFECPFLGHDSQNLPYCRIYGDLRPAACKIYPFDKVDSEIEQCGFRFD